MKNIICSILTTVLLMTDSKAVLSLLVNRLLCTFNDLTELGAYIVQGILNTPKVNTCMSTVSKIHWVQLNREIAFHIHYTLHACRYCLLTSLIFFCEVCRYGIQLLILSKTDMITMYSSIFLVHCSPVVNIEAVWLAHYPIWNML